MGGGDVDRGWIRLWRQSQSSIVFQNPVTWKIWTWCLMKAAYKRHLFTVQTGRGLTEVEVDEGQFVFGRKAAARELRLKPSTIRNHMMKLKRGRNIDMQPDTHYTLVTINGWGRYQSGKNETGQATGQAKDRQRTGKGQKQE